MERFNIDDEVMNNEQTTSEKNLTEIKKVGNDFVNSSMFEYFFYILY